MAIGFGVLRLSPRAFWSMTPRELASALGGTGARPGAAPTRGVLDGLMTAFPDSKENRRG